MIFCEEAFFIIYFIVWKLMMAINYATKTSPLGHQIFGRASNCNIEENGCIVIFNPRR